MISKKEIEAGRAFVRLFLKNDFKKQLVGALNNAGNHLRSWGRNTMMAGATVTAAGTAILTPLAMAVKSFAEQGNVLDKTSKRVGITASSLAELGFALEQSSDKFQNSEAAIGGLETGIRRMQKTISDVALGLSTDMTRFEAAFKVMKISLPDLVGKSPEEQLNVILHGIEGISDATYRAGLMTMFFGRSGTQLLPMIENLSALRQEARDLGIVPTEEEVKKAARLTDAINRIRRVVKQMFFDIGAALADQALEFLDWAKEIAISIGKFAKANGPLILTIAGVGAALVVAGGALTAFGAAIWGTGTVLSTLAAIVGALLSPIGLIVAAVTAGAVAWVKFTESGQHAWKALKATALPIIEEMKTAFGAIWGALKAGDLQAAVDVLWAYMRLQWTKGTNWLYKKWAEFRDSFLDIWNEATTGLAMMFTDAVAWMEKVYVRFTNYLLTTMMHTGIAIHAALIDAMPDWLAEKLDIDKQARRMALSLARPAVSIGMEGERNKQLEEVEQERKQRQQMLGEELNTRQEQRDKARGEELLDREKAVVEAEFAFTAAVKTAVIAAKQTEAAKGETAQPGGAVVTAPAAPAAPRGIALTATYSAKAAQIAGYQPGGGGAVAGPEEQMAVGIAAIDENTKEMLIKMGEWMAQNASLHTLYERFLAGWNVT
jgi:hypothetical protein